MKEKKDILLVCQTFPPVPGIGGRRWAKFSKYLSRVGFRIHVITTPHNQETRSKWTQDVHNNPNIISYPIPNPYPEWKPSKSLLGKIRNRLTYWKLLASTRGTPFDKSIYWHAAVKQKTTQLLQQHSISTFILTGAPFHHFYHLGKLKQQFPSIQLILDFRDPWTQGTAYGMKEISPKRFAYEQQIEQEALRQADLIIGPYDPTIMLGKTLEDSGTQAQKSTIPHAYDPEDLPAKDKASPKEQDHLKLIYGGSLYPGVEPYLRQLAIVLRDLQHKNPDDLKKFSFSFYTPETHLSNIFEGLPQSVVHFHAPVSHKEILNKVQQSDVCLLFLNEEKKHFRTTKFAEFSTLGRPFLLFGPEGEVAEFIDHHQIGRTISDGQFDRHQLLAILQELQHIDAYQSNFQYEQYSYPAVTHKLVQLMDVQQPSNQTQQIHV